MRILLTTALIVFLSFSSFVLAQRSPNWIAGSNTAKELLLRLTNPKDTDFRVGIINTAAEIGVLISPKGGTPTADQYSGYSTDRQSGWRFTWSAREQLDADSERLVFEVSRKTIESRSCLILGESLDKFYVELESTLQSPISLSDIPRKRELKQITVDGTSYIIQVWTGERLIAIYPDRDIDEALDRASAQLMGVIGRCSNNQRATIEEHHFN